MNILEFKIKFREFVIMAYNPNMVNNEFHLELV